MKKILFFFVLFISAYSVKATIHTVYVWDGYMKFTDSNLFVLHSITIQLGDTVQWLPFDPPTMLHTITSTNIPAGAATFDYQWQLPADTFFQYVPQIPGVYDYVCTPHIPMGMISSIIVESPTSIKEPESVNDFKYYPNPTKNIIRIESEYIGNDYEIFDMNGKLVLSGTIASHLINLEDLAAGSYNFRLAGNKTKVIKIIKQ